MDAAALLQENESLKLALATQEKILTAKDKIIATKAKEYTLALATQDLKLSENSAKLESQASRIALQTAKIESLEAQLQWFRNQLFGARSEKRVNQSSPQQLSLFDNLETPELPPSATVTVKEYEKSNRKQRIQFTESECRLQFDERVPVEVIEVPNPVTAKLTPEEYEVVSTREKHVLCAKPAQYYIKKYVQPVVKVNNQLFTPESPNLVIDKSYGDASFLAHLIVQKFKYHLPLYRQHQMMEECGIHVARSTLSRFIHRCSEMLEPIYLALVSSVLQSQTIAIDETPLKVGVSNTRKGMHTGYLVPMYGDNHEVVFHYSPTRALNVITTILGDYHGTILTDGYRYYENLANTNGITHALCWSHARREFLKAEALKPDIVNPVLHYIRQLYEIESQLKDKPPSEVLNIRQQNSKPLVDTLFKHYYQLLNTLTLVPSDPLTKAILYSTKREVGLRVFLDDPTVSIDTNHLEREIRPTAVGRKNWLFCMNDVGARAVAIFASLTRTCELHNVNQFNYFNDILTRINQHKVKHINMLTPANWKITFS
jgi:transposase